MALRMMAGATAKEMARLLQAKPRAYLALEANKADITDDMIERIAALLDVPPDTLTAGALPVPAHLGTPLDAESEAGYAYLEALEALERLDRIRQSAKSEWPQVLRANALPHIPLPYPRTLLEIVHDVELYIELPHVVSLASRKSVQIARPKENPITLLPKRKVLLKPGAVVFSHFGVPGRVRIFPHSGTMVSYEY